MSEKPKKVFYKLWFAKSKKESGDLNYYFVPDGVLIEGYDRNGLFKTKVDKYSVDYSGLLRYDVNRLLKPLKDGDFHSMVVEAISYLAWLRLSLYNKKYNRINQGMKFLLGYLKVALGLLKIT